MNLEALYDGVKSAMNKMKKGRLAEHFSNENQLFPLLYPLIRNLMIRSEIDSNEIQCQVFVVQGDKPDWNDINACLGIPQDQKLDVMGSGHFGTVYRLKKTKKSGSLFYAVKLERLSHPYWQHKHPDKNPANVLCASTEIARKAGELGIGPKIHASFVCNRGGKPYFVTVMEFLEGSDVMTWKKSIEKVDGKIVTKVRKLFEKRLDQLTQLGIRHNDLYNLANIMVIHPRGEPTKVKDVKVIDFGIANTTDDVIYSENDNIKRQFNSFIGMHDDDNHVLQVMRVIRHLVSDGILLSNDSILL